jgi:hypothetical protein
LQYIANKYNLQLLSNEGNTHILTKHPIRKDFFKLLHYYNKIRNKFDITRRFKKDSKTWGDHESILARDLN